MRRVGASGTVIALAIMATAACGGDEGSGGGTGGTVSTTSNGGSGGSGSGGDGGSGGGAGGSEPVGSPPEWAPHTDIAGCPVERVANRDAVRVFQWAACEGVDDCETVVPLQPWDFGADDLIIIGGSVRSTSVDTVLAARLFDMSGTSYDMALFVKGDGWLADGFRMHGSTECRLNLTSVGWDNYGFTNLQGPGSSPKIGGIVSPLDHATPPVSFAYEPKPNGASPGANYAMGSGRWLWQVLGNSLASVSVIDGSDYTVVIEGANSDPPLIDANYPSATPTGFVFETRELLTGTHRGRILWTDGTSAPTLYLESTDGSYYGRPGYAHSHLGFFRGIDQLGLNQYSAVEVWSTPYSSDPGQLAPQKVADYPASYIPGAVSYGHGRMAASSGSDLNADREVAVWDLGDGTTQLFELPEGFRLSRNLGITPEGVWVSAEVDEMGNPPTRIFRFLVP